MDGVNITAISGGLGIGLIFGIVLQRSRFCMVAAVSNLVLIRDYRQGQAFLAAPLVNLEHQAGPGLWRIAFARMPDREPEQHNIAAPDVSGPMSRLLGG